MTNKMTGYLGLASVLLCLMLMTACANSSTSSSSGGAHGTSATATSKASAAAMIARKASGQKTAPKATPKPVVITMPPKPTPTSAPTQPPAPVVVPTTPPMTMPTPTPQTIIVTNPGVPAAAAAVLTLINQERQSQNIGPLTWDAELQKSAHVHNLAMAAANTMSHQLPGEAAFGDRERAEGVNWTSAAENIGWGTGDPTQVASGINIGMFNETPQSVGGDGHRLNILSSSSNVIGIDVLVDTTNNKVWLTEDFAHI